MDESKSVSNLDSHQFIESFSQQWHAAMNDSDAERMFGEFCDVDQLLALLEEFLLNMTVLVYGDVSHKMLQGLCEDECISWSSTEASTPSLTTGGLVLASICVSVDQIGFTCEISYHLFSTRKINLSILLKLLHIFAHLCGPKYFTLEDYGLEMCVLKSLVVFLEEMMKIPACSVCPFSQDAPSIDLVVSLLLEKLRGYVLSGTEKEDICQAHLLSMNVSKDKLNCFIDILSLVELVGRIMTWGWTFVNIISPIFTILDLSIPGNLLSAVIAHLGQLGRIGIDSKGYEDSHVGIVRNWLVGFVCRETFRSYDINTQFVSVAALVGLVGKPFDEIMNSNNEDSPRKDYSQSVAVV